ncbi:MAG: hypothetical protein A3D24_03635 [Candidatus Blackburnbacteria bacterium RIFCSPHIGHO2_02_FULL_39_13]|uniref:Uncharacterized protein n=1 Tax=Candidatus Blackburnbacteria bacterium RIFCSPLOWO2_01_FULL_40_20 TaxID=1797519 RepID=A0A1G1VEH2_9BACT|nr:MAG: hypothetical protein A2694_01235 [Candidatus Blackburnbacteria bacterium RIFCSPHIGHO2_01_FULL_40_17]OGY09994.1 MAG: hypothetical protein A3D24_03635 [Candidatus Blackburnbacteria bacterium RIFCSPHIGHO2_02_FULL_39_13]OGY13840.1 MAG: hypothetical protein A3A77_03625 [Candidatus Blackburnbacteria bacterium RIFCSPLOWO2_01_FULL_40_20]HBL52026.1 hypothetical protein [Candidatus Blackburnbacteria bacterium]
MPRKTKKQKIDAEKRRTTDIATTSLVKREFEFNFDDKILTNHQKSQAKKSEISLSSGNPRLILLDLIKTVILAGLIFSLEIVIYFAWLKK